MGIFFVYILKSAICLALFYLFYRLLLSRETFHRFNRVALLGLLVLSCVVPLIEVGSEAVNVVNRQFFSWEEMLMMAELNSGVAAEVVETYSWREVLLLVYLVGIAFFLVRNLWSLGRMYGLIDGCKKRKLDDGVLLFIHQKTITPFSWMKCIVVSEKDYVESGETILTHERAHIANHHSWDLLLADLCVFFQWFNPAAWLLKQELQNIHEYEADEWVINQGIDAKTYQLLLIKKAVGTRLYSMANNLNHSNLKKRITMMIKKKSNPWACMKYLYILPLATIAVAAFARPEISNEFDEISSAKVSDLASFMKADGENYADNLSDKKKKVKVAGRVLDENKQPVVGVSVLVRGTTNGTLAGAEGKFSIEAHEGDVLMFSYVGLQPQSVIVPKNGAKEMDVMLLPDVRSLDEVTVVSYPAQGNAEPRAEATPSASGEDELIFEVVEEAPEFPGGMRALMEYLAKNIRYPAKAHEANVQGRVITQFTVGRDGAIRDAKVVRSVSPELDAEALRVINAMPNWKPGKQRGKAVACHFTVPVMFRLDEPEKPTLKIGDKEVSKILVDGKEVPIGEFVENHPAGIGSFAEGEIHSTDAADQVFEIVEEAPEFPGGMQALMEYLAKNIRYPVKAHEANVQGRVITQFTVGKDGAIRDAKVMRSVSPELDAEALRVISAMPNWKPGKQRGKAVACHFTVPVVFRLMEPERTETQVVHVRVDGDVPMGTVNEVKEHLRKGYVTQINYSLGDKPTEEGGLVFRGNSESVLVIVDGVEKGYGTETLSSVSPKDVSAIWVLKPENAIAAYGEKAKDGAIVIVTKEGEKAMVGKVVYYPATAESPTAEDVRVVASGSMSSPNARLGIISRTVTSPLIVVDGVEKGYGQEVLDKLNPQDIESITVLKEKSSVEAFGDRGKNGVILITTKKASK